MFSDLAIQGGPVAVACQTEIACQNGFEAPSLNGYKPCSRLHHSSDGQKLIWFGSSDTGQSDIVGKKRLVIFIWEQDFSRNSLQMLINMLLKALLIIYKDTS